MYYSLNMQDKNKTETSWGAVAGWYDELLEESPDSFQAQVILPNLLRILDIKPGMKIIDIACGQGYFSRALAASGAEVVGVDISSELIAAGRGRSPKNVYPVRSRPLDHKSATVTSGQPASNGVSFHVASADKLTFAKNNFFDAAVIILSLQNIENISPVLAECSRVLKPKGRLIIALNHPTFRIPQKSSWGWDEKHGKQYRRIDSYLKEYQVRIDMTPGEKDKAKKKTTLSFHRPLQSYFKFLNKAGFKVFALEEWVSHKKSQKGPRSSEEDRIRKEIPMFLMLQAEKI